MEQYVFASIGVFYIFFFFTQAFVFHAVLTTYMSILLEFLFYFQVLGVEKEKVSKERALADEEEKKVAAITVTVSAKQKDCQKDLDNAQPLLEAALKALDTLNKVSSYGFYSLCFHLPSSELYPLACLSKT